VKKALTLVEILLIITIIGIVSMAISSFLRDTDRRKMLQAETCLNEMNVNLKHFTNAAMTNRKLIISSTGSVFPDHYLIRFEPATFSPL